MPITKTVSIDATREDIIDPNRSEATLVFERADTGDIWLTVKYGYPDEKNRGTYIISKSESWGLLDLVNDDE